MKYSCRQKFLLFFRKEEEEEKGGEREKEEKKRRKEVTFEYQMAQSTNILRLSGMKSIEISKR